MAADPARDRRLRVDDPDFEVRELTADLVVRWEYGPGCTAFGVWCRDDAASVFLLKWSRWMGK